MKNLTYTIGTMMEIAGVVVLTVSAIKAENERHKAVKELHKTNMLLCSEKIQNVLLTMENISLKNQLKKETEEEH